MVKIGYLNSTPSKIHSINKSVLADGESSFEDVEGIYQGDDPEYYEISGAPDNPSLSRKSQAAIDSIIAAKAQAAADYQQKHSDANDKLQELAGWTYAELNTYIDSNVTDMASAKAYLKKLSRVVLAILKKQDWSE